jgi:hypothetical protein
MSIPTDQTELRDVVRAKYAAAATVTTDENASAASCSSADGALITPEQRELFGSPLYEQRTARNSHRPPCSPLWLR